MSIYIHCLYTSISVTILNYNIDYNLNILSRSPNSIFTTKKGLSLVPISINLAYRRAYYIGENRVRKIETYTEGIKLKKRVGITFSYILYIKGKGYILLFSKERSIRLKLGEFLYLNV